MRNCLTRSRIRRDVEVLILEAMVYYGSSVHLSGSNPDAFSYQWPLSVATSALLALRKAATICHSIRPSSPERRLDDLLKDLRYVMTRLC
mmetsp:Transcript_9385/g.14830  ORF Transcript_9385/g.14830 Transcript_9385/m.14830 type:complete len:90 (+) Transcript_9385:63-332(+)